MHYKMSTKVTIVVFLINKMLFSRYFGINFVIFQIESRNTLFELFCGGFCSEYCQTVSKNLRFFVQLDLHKLTFFPYTTE